MLYRMVLSGSQFLGYAYVYNKAHKLQQINLRLIGNVSLSSFYFLQDTLMFSIKLF